MYEEQKSTLDSIQKLLDENECECSEIEGQKCIIKIIIEGYLKAMRGEA